MKSDNLHGEKLIFLISQPRAGSTMLQRILGGHSDVHTLPEPWIMLHLLDVLRPIRSQPARNTEYTYRALNEFISGLPHGSDDYLESVRHMATRLYGKVLAGSGAKYFLDKTPRYYLITQELAQTFDKARFIVLIRHPIAVMCSILNTWVKNDWFKFSEFKEDLITGPERLSTFTREHKDNVLTVHFENILTDAGAEIKKICEWLGIEFQTDMIDYGKKRFDGLFGDQDNVNRYSRPRSVHAGYWEKALVEPQIWRLARDYLDLLGPDTLSQQGYSFEQTKRTIQDNRPAEHKVFATYGFQKLMSKPTTERKKWELLIASTRRIYLKHGLMRLIPELANKAGEKLSP